MPKSVEDIPFLVLQEQSHFLIRPLLSEVNPSAMKEAAHRHTYQEILWIQEGNGQQTIDDQIFMLEQHTFYLIYQGQIHHFIKGNNLKGFLIRFNNEFLNEISPLERISTPIINKITLENEPEIQHFNILVNVLFQEFNHKTQHQEPVIRHLLMVLLYKLAERKQALQLTTAKNSIAEDAIFLSFTHILEQEFTKTADTYDYARKIGISARQLCAIVKQHSGKNTKQLIIDRRILEAKRLIAYTQNSLKQIAFQLGFEDNAYFCRVFKNQTGCTPTEFKIKINAKQKVQ
jgi:AraC family transcriptional regulator, transcriptional activator of pobA